MSFEAGEGFIVEFSAKQVRPSTERPHGIDYALVLRPASGGAPLVRFDNAHGVPHRGGRHVRRKAAHDHWHRTPDDPGRPYHFTTPARRSKISGVK